MNTTRRRILAAVGASPLAILAGCASGGGATSPSPGEPVHLDIRVEKGAVTPNGRRIEVTKGRDVSIALVSDVEVIVHVHGYDKELHSTGATPVLLTFRADLAGTFEVETHDPARIVALLVVR